MNARKLSASLPADQFDDVERARKKLGMGRSETVQAALSLWLSAHQRDGRVVRYLAGYVNHPEDGRETQALVKAWTVGMTREEW